MAENVISTGRILTSHRTVRDRALTALGHALPVIFSLYVMALCSSMSLMEITSTALFAILALYFAFAHPTRKNWEAPPFWKPIVAFVVVALIGIFLGDSTAKQKFYDVGRMRFFLIYGCLFYYLRFFEVKRYWIYALLAATLAVGIYGFFQHFMPLTWHVNYHLTNYSIDSKRLGYVVIGTFAQHLSFSNIYLFYACLFLSLGLYFFPRRPYFFAMGCFLYLLVVMSESRTGWLAIPFTLVCIGIAKGWKVVASGLALTAVSLVFFSYTDPGFKERLQNGLGKEEQHGLGPRIQLWNAQLEFFKEHPLFGVGYNNNERQAKAMVDRLYPDTIETNFYGHAHSTFLQLLASTGLLGVVCFLWIWVEVFRKNVFLLRNLARSDEAFWIALACLAGFIGFHIQGITQWNFGDAKVVHNVMFFWALVAALYAKQRAKLSSRV